MAQQARMCSSRCLDVEGLTDEPGHIETSHYSLTTLPLVSMAEQIAQAQIVALREASSTPHPSR